MDNNFNFPSWNNGLVVDVSRYQRKIIADLLAMAGVRMVIAKMSSGTGEDIKFVQHAESCLVAGMPLSVYHWVDPILNAKPQAEFVLKLLEKYIAKYGIKVIFLDCEQQWAVWGEYLDYLAGRIILDAVTRLSPSRISDVCLQVAEYLQARLGIPVVIYTSRGFVTSYAPQMATWLPRFPLWLAKYIWQVEKKTLTWDEFKAFWLPNSSMQIQPPPGAGRIIGLQFTGDTFMLEGMYSDDKALYPSPADVSTFDPEWLDLIVGQLSATITPAPVETLPVITPASLQGVVLGTPYINVRTGPGTQYQDIGDLPAGYPIGIKSIGGSDVWVEFEAGKWACVKKGNTQLVEIKLVK